jgi:hypothetical protein
VRNLLLGGATQGRHPNDFSDLAEVQNRLAAFQEHYNLAARPFNWTYTTKTLTISSTASPPTTPAPWQPPHDPDELPPKTT